MSDASLKAQIDSDKAKQDKYKRVRDSIQNHGLDTPPFFRKRNRN